MSGLYLLFIILPKLIECDGAGGGDVQGIHAVGHWDAHGIIAMLDGVIGQAGVALGAEDYRKLFLRRGDGDVLMLGEWNHAAPSRRYLKPSPCRKLCQPSGRYVHGT